MEKIFQKWLGKRYQENDNLRYQCVAWTKKFVSEYYGVTLGRFGDSAINGWINRNHRTFSSEKFSQIPYQKGNIPPAGAIIFWGKTANNPYGHVAIVDEGSTAEKFVIIEQNGGRGSADGLSDDAIRRVIISPNDRGNCLGWFIFNEKIMENIKIGSVNNYAEILKNELEKNKSYVSKFTEYKGENVLSEKETKELIEIVAIRLEKEIKNYIDEKFLAFTRDILKKN